MTIPEIPPRGVSYKLCDFFTENFYPASCEVEFLTVEAVRRVIQPSDSVLEIGSRYGTTTCEVAVRQNNSANLVAVEPDHTVWAAAEVITPITITINITITLFSLTRGLTTAQAGQS